MPRRLALSIASKLVDSSPERVERAIYDVYSLDSSRDSLVETLVEKENYSTTGRSYLCANLKHLPAFSTLIHTVRRVQRWASPVDRLSRLRNKDSTKSERCALIGRVLQKLQYSLTNRLSFGPPDISPDKPLVRTFLLFIEKDNRT